MEYFHLIVFVLAVSPILYFLIKSIDDDDDDNEDTDDKIFIIRQELKELREDIEIIKEAIDGRQLRRKKRRR